MHTLKIWALAFALSGAGLFTSCNSNSKTETQSADGHDHDHAGQEHTFACPMHPEVTGKEGDLCPKCGMKLEHNDHATTGNGNTYVMDLKTQPATVVPNQEVTIAFTPKIEGKADEQVPLQEDHGKKIHLIVVSDDLSQFQHIHPDYQADGSYQVKTTLPTGGKYHLYADYKPTGGNATVNKMDITVSGNQPAARQYAGDKLTASPGDGFTVSLRSESGKMETNTLTHLSAAVTQNGKAIDPNNLEDYLGAKAHMVVISLNEKEYLHVHPGVKNGKFDLQTTFEKPGTYRGWIQFQDKGKVYTADFVMQVQPGSATAKADAEKDGMKH